MWRRKRNSVKKKKSSVNKLVLNYPSCKICINRIKQLANTNIKKVNQLNKDFVINITKLKDYVGSTKKYC